MVLENRLSELSETHTISLNSFNISIAYYKKVENGSTYENLSLSFLENGGLKTYQIDKVKNFLDACNGTAELLKKPEILPALKKNLPKYIFKLLKKVKSLK